MTDTNTIIEEKGIKRLEDLIINVDGKDYTVVSVLDNGYYCCHIKEETGILFQSSFEHDIARLATIGIQSWNKHMSKWGMKNMKVYDTKFDVGQYIVRLSWTTPYQSKYWLWYFRKGQYTNSITIRILGLNLHIGKKGSLDKLLAKIHS